MKTPEQYFEEQVFDPDQEKHGEFSPAEKQFIEKYLDGQVKDTDITEVRPLEKDHQPVPFQESPEPKPGPEPETAAPALSPKDIKKQEPVIKDKDQLKSHHEVQLVSFFMGKQEYALPIEKVKEVIKYIQPTKLPSAPHYLDGIINLRQRVTPIVRLASLLSPDKEITGENRFIVVCHQDGLQVGLLVERIATMYRMPREDIEWNVESALAMGSGFVSALIKNRERIISILSIETIVNHLLKG